MSAGVIKTPPTNTTPAPPTKSSAPPPTRPPNPPPVPAPKPTPRETPLPRCLPAAALSSPHPLNTVCPLPPHSTTKIAPDFPAPPSTRKAVPKRCSATPVFPDDGSTGVSPIVFPTQPDINVRRRKGPPFIGNGVVLPDSSSLRIAVSKVDTRGGHVPLRFGSRPRRSTGKWWILAVDPLRRWTPPPSHRAEKERVHNLGFHLLTLAQPQALESGLLRP